MNLGALFGSVLTVLGPALGGAITGVYALLGGVLGSVGGALGLVGGLLSGITI